MPPLASLARRSAEMGGLEGKLASYSAGLTKTMGSLKQRLADERAARRKGLQQERRAVPAGTRSR